MTYCLGLLAETGLVFISDSRTNAGVDNVMSFSKMFDFRVPDERLLVIMTAGNLSVTQSVLAQLSQQIELGIEPNLFSQPTLYATAAFVGEILAQKVLESKARFEGTTITSGASLILGGQIKGAAPTVFRIYGEGNCIQATYETPFMQIGETKYGKTILDRAFRFDSDLMSAARCAIISMDATMRSNLSVGPPIDIAVYEIDTFKIARRRRFQERDRFLIDTRRHWEKELQQVIARMPMVPWE